MKTLTQLSAQVLEKAQELNHQQMENVIGGGQQRGECFAECGESRFPSGDDGYTPNECERLKPSDDCRCVCPG